MVELLKGKYRMLYILLGYFILIVMAYSTFFNYRITSDYVANYSVVGTSSWLDSIRSIKFSMAGGVAVVISQILSSFFRVLGQDRLFNTSIIQIVSMLMYAVVALVIYISVEKRTGKSSMVILLLVSICVINPFIIEGYIYNAYTCPIGILCVALSAYYISEKKYFRGIILGYLAQNFYQIYIFMILILLITYCYLENRDRKFMEVFVLEVKTILLGIIGPMVYFVQYTCSTIKYGAIADSKNPLVAVTSVQTNNVDGEGAKSQLFLRFQRYWDAIDTSYKNAYYYMPENFLRVFVVLFLLLGIIAAYLICKKNKKNINIVVTWIVFMISMVLLSCGFFFVIGYGAFARVMVPLFFALSMMCIGMYELIHDADNTVLTYIACFTLLFFGLVIYVKNQSFVTDSYIAQAEDEFVARMVGRRIKNYEEWSGIQIDEIAATRDFCRQYYDEQINKDYTYNHKIFYDSWAMGEYINLINGTNYSTRVMTTEEVEEFFPYGVGYGFDLSTQLVFDDDVVYWAAY